jgi:hypothetical protein
VKDYAAVSHLVVAPLIPWYYVADNEGAVYLKNTENNDQIDVIKFDTRNISHLTFSNNASHVAASHVAAIIYGRTISINKISPSPQGHNVKNYQLESLPYPKSAIEGYGIQQILFSRDARFLLIYSRAWVHIWSLDLKRLDGSITLDPKIAIKWVNHPVQCDLLLGFDTKEVHVFRWESFAKVRCVWLRDPGQQHEHMFSEFATSQQQSHFVHRVLQNPRHGQILVQIKDSYNQQPTRHLLYFHGSAFENIEVQSSIDYIEAPLNIARQADTILGIFENSIIAFLDQELWLWMVSVNPGEPEISPQRCFFIPRDWLGKSSPDRCCMQEDGRLICPKDNEVGEFRSNVVMEILGEKGKGKAVGG